MELLVSILLGLLLVAGIVSAYLGATQNYYYDEQMARMQENGRYAMRLLSREFAMAGFYAGVPRAVDIAAASVGTDCSEIDWALESNAPLDLINDYAGDDPPVSRHLTVFTCLDAGTIARDTDLIALKRTAVEPSLRRGITAESLTPSTVEAWYLRLESGVNPLWQQTRAINLPAIGEGSPSSSYWEAVARILFVRNYANEAGDGIPSLCMETLAGNALTSRCLVEGVENLQLEFGIDTDGDGVPNRYQTAPTGLELRNTVAVKIHLLLRSIVELTGHRDDKRYQLGQKLLPATHDAYLRRVMSSTVVLRNRVSLAG